MGEDPLKKTRLHGLHVSAGARMTGFGGWDMPVQYLTGPREEHLRVRNAAGLFDIDHMGRFALSGRGAFPFLQSIQTWDVSRVPPGYAHYSLMCTERGGIVDDIFIYHLRESEAEHREWLIVVNAGNRDKDLAWMSERAGRFDAGVNDVSSETCMTALQGPAARLILQSLTEADVSAMAYHRVMRSSVAGASCTLCTTGYTGEPGFEILIPADRAEKVWGALLEAGETQGLIPCGLAARDSLRAEASLPLYEHEITEDTDPFSAGLGKAAVSLEGHDFIGKTALLALSRNPSGRRLACFRMVEAAVPRRGYRVAAGGAAIGAVTTGLFSPSTNRYIGMGYLEAGHAGIGNVVDIVIRDSPKPARVVERPFYRSPHWPTRL
jgi:aminomethyltransferase